MNVGGFAFHTFYPFTSLVSASYMQSLQIGMRFPGSHFASYMQSLQISKRFLCSYFALSQHAWMNSHFF